MNRVMLSAATILAAALPQIVSAQQATGTVDVSGRVGGRCAVDSGGTLGTAASGTIALGELAGPSGALAANFTSSTASGSVVFRVVCTSPMPAVELRATRLANPASAPAGYANAVDYTAQVAVTQASGTPPAITYLTSSSPAAPTKANLTGRLANAPGNLVVQVHSLNTSPADALLVEGDYAGQIVVTITPS